MANGSNAPQPGYGQNPYAQQQAQPPVQPPVQPPLPPQAMPPIQQRQVPGGYHPCPQCGGVNIQKVGFTWWGGLLGPSLFCHVKCQQCHTTFNGKTGKSNNTAIAIYVIAGVVIAIVLIALLGLANM